MLFVVRFSERHADPSQREHFSGHGRDLAPAEGQPVGSRGRNLQPERLLSTPDSQVRRERSDYGTGRQAEGKGRPERRGMERVGWMQETRNELNTQIENTSGGCFRLLHACAKRNVSYRLVGMVPHAGGRRASCWLCCVPVPFGQGRVTDR